MHCDTCGRIGLNVVDFYLRAGVPLRPCRECRKKASRERKRALRAAARNRPLLLRAKKCCQACGVLKPGTAKFFYRRIENTDGLSDQCKTCYRSYYKDYSKRNHTKISDGKRKYFLLNHARLLAEMRWRYEENPEPYKRRAAAYQKEHPEVRRTVKSRRRARNYAAPGRFIAKDICQLYAAQNGRCFYCDDELHNTYHVDHKTPLVLGGSNWPSNLALACGPCNLSKNRRTAEEYIELRLRRGRHVAARALEAV